MQRCVSESVCAILHVCAHMLYVCDCRLITRLWSIPLPLTWAAA